MIFLAMLIMGAVIGFVGAGGAGVTIALLTLAFQVPIHTAVAVALAAMTFTMLSGAYSHFREREVEVPTGLAMGLGGVMGAFIGANVSNLLPAPFLRTMTAIMLCASALLLYTKVYQAEWLSRRFHPRQELLTGGKLYRLGIITGMVNGFLSGAFGIGAAAFIQITLMVLFGVSLLKSIGTCMMIILPMSAAGGLGYFFTGHLDLWIFIQTLTGQAIGAWFGAKYTHLAPLPLLRFAIVATPTIGGLSLLLM
ncbi:sulfite exporter TauE/SafE family protein [Selenomonas sp. AB3002]|uniref:sulfite exporter TauE/SafE family protein n=1 Tax=Selenomonas sp. AB3002 TaxID=1392502 RepID=UPI0004965D44